MTDSELTILRDALHHAHPNNTRTYRDRQHAKGVLVGLVAGMMATGMFFDDAWQLCLRQGPINRQCVPSGWPALEDYMEAARQESIAKQKAFMASI